MRSFWHPYTNDAEDAMIDVTGLSAVSVLVRVINEQEPTAEDAYRLAHALQNHRPFNDPRLGCLRHVE